MRSYKVSHHPPEFQKNAGNAYWMTATLPYPYCKIWWGANVELHYMEIFVQQVMMDEQFGNLSPYDEVCHMYTYTYM